MQTSTQSIIADNFPSQIIGAPNSDEKIIPLNGLKPHISVKNLSVSYGENRILKNVSIDIPDKKITAIIGPSGCGKTTAVKTFNRLIESSDGIKISGRSIARW